ncbi:MAG: hypothetical protein U0835_17550 [Isosphaeraceae bacterium]
MTASTRFDAAAETVPTPNLRDAQAVADLFVGFFRRDLHNFFPQSRFEPLSRGPGPAELKAGPRFSLVEGGGPDGDDLVSMFGAPYAVGPREGAGSPTSNDA